MTWLFPLHVRNSLVRNSGCRKQVGREVHCMRSKRSPCPQDKCKKEDPIKVLTSPSLGPIPITVEPSELFFSTSGQGEVMYRALQGQMVQKKNVTWGKRSNGLGRAPQRVACWILFSLLPHSLPIRAKMTAFSGFWYTTPAIFTKSNWLRFSEKPLTNRRKPVCKMKVLTLFSVKPVKRKCLWKSLQSLSPTCDSLQLDNQ